MLSVSAGNVVTVWSALMGFACLVAGAVAGYFVYGGKRNSDLSEQQDRLITAYRGELDLANQKIAALTKQVETQEQQIVALQQMVLQTAKVDALRNEMRDGLKAIMGKLDNGR